MKTKRTSNKIKSNSGLIFSAPDFLDFAGVPGRDMHLQKSQEAYAQGDPATSVMYIQEGKVKLSVVNELGKEAIVAILGPGDFFGEGCLADQPVRMGTATALMPTIVFVIQKSDMRLTGCGKQELPEEALPKMSQEMLSEMVGTTRSRVNSFMGKFRKLDYIEYEDGLHITPSLINVLQE
jgi:CRP/FNR family cyclic AMP-dependent transcriptional regulator